MQLSADRRDGFSAISNIVKDSGFRIGLERSCHEKRSGKWFCASPRRYLPTSGFWRGCRLM